MVSFEQCFAAVLEYCRDHIVEATYNLFMRDIKPVELKDGVAVLRVDNDFQYGVVHDRYMNELRDGFREVLGFDVDIRLEVADEKESESAAQTLPPLTLEDTYTFENFIVSDNNRMAYAAAQSAAARPGFAHNPLFIYGSSGLGKTHLLVAIKNAAAKTFPGRNILYINSESFMNQLVSALQHETMSEFHDSFRSVDMLLMDDVQFLAGKEKMQEEMFYTFNALHNVGKQIVLTSDRPPKEIKTLESRLLSRFEWGLIIDISAPDLETKVAILKSKAESLGFDLPNDVATHISSHVGSNIRQLEGVVKKLHAYLMINGAKPTLGLAQNALKDIQSEQPPASVTVSRIIDEVSRTFNVTPEELRSPKRNDQIANARHIAVYIIREVTNMTLEAIGEEFERHYSTVIASIENVENRIKTDNTLKLTIEDIIHNCTV